MEFSGIGPNTPNADRWQEVAKQIADIIRVSGIEIFRQAVRRVACNRLKIEDERERREEERREALKKDGVLYRDGSIPGRPKGDWYFHQDILGGLCQFTLEGQTTAEAAGASETSGVSTGPQTA